MDVVTSLIARIEEYRSSNKNPCKSYKTEAAAKKAVAEAAKKAGNLFDTAGNSARYIVFFVPAWGRWVGAMDYTELLRRPTATGGYLGAVTGFYTY
jgi:hypothetical protein